MIINQNLHLKSNIIRNFNMSSNLSIMILNGPNLNLLGKREPSIYGNESFDTVLNQLKSKYAHVDLHYFQSNVEGELINKLQEVGFSFHGIVFNPGGYTHTSVAIGDTIASIKTPVIEVHISNIHAREEFRKISLISAKTSGSIVGFGVKGYELAILSLLV